jgi:hypothetical protein
MTVAPTFDLVCGEFDVCMGLITILRGLDVQR